MQGLTPWPMGVGIDDCRKGMRHLIALMHPSFKRHAPGWIRATTLLILLLSPMNSFGAEAPPWIEVEGQPLAAQVERLVQALEFLGEPLAESVHKELGMAVEEQNSRRLQELLDPLTLLVVEINPEVRVKARRGPAPARLQQSGYVPFLLKVINESTATKPLRIRSPQAGPVYAGASHGSLTRQQQTHLNEGENLDGRTDRFLDLELYTAPPMSTELSGLEVEYLIVLVYSSEAGKREAVLRVDAGEGSQDLGFRGEVAVLFDIRPAVPVRLKVMDEEGGPTTGRFVFTDATGKVHPPQAKRRAPDLFFQKQIYRKDGQVVLLPPGTMTMQYGRGPEYRWKERQITVPERGDAQMVVRMERWIHPAAHGYYSGDHHIHAAGCAHFRKPSEGVGPEEMFLQVQGEGLNVGCVLTWGPGFQHQHQFFSPVVAQLSEPFTVLKYDIEVSGFGSQALGHVCLLNLKEPIYPGATGTRDWPTWTTPVLRWAKAQGAYTGYAHSGSGLQIRPDKAGPRLLSQLDSNHDGLLTPSETEAGLLPEPFDRMDSNGDGHLAGHEIIRSLNRVADQLPNLAIPELDSVGAQEIFVTAAHGLCDFISAMDTARLLEWNCWYHLLNCGLPIKVSGETDFPCMSGTRVGQGRVYVRLGDVDRIDFEQWCEGLAKGRSYVSDGYAHALDFFVNGRRPGETVSLDTPRVVKVEATVAFSSETPLEVAHGALTPAGGLRLAGDTVNRHEGTEADALHAAGKRKVELIINGQVVSVREVPADDQVHELDFDVMVSRSSWIALRQFPQLHTNPVEVTVDGQPIRASRNSALWSVECIRQLWRSRGGTIAEADRDAAERTFQRAIEYYRKVAMEAPRDR